MKKNLVIFFLFLVLSNCGISSQFSINNTTDTPVQIDIISDEFHYTIDTLWQNSASDFKIMEEVFTQHNFSMKSCKALGGDKGKITNNSFENVEVCFDSFIQLKNSFKLSFELLPMEKVLLYKTPNMDNNYPWLSSVDTIILKGGNFNIQLNGPEAIKAALSNKGNCTNCELLLGDLIK